MPTTPWMSGPNERLYPHSTHCTLMRATITKLWASRPENAKDIAELKVISTGSDVAAQIAAIDNFIQAGYAILAPNVRGSTGYGTAFMNLDNTTKRMDSVKDLAYAAYWLRDQKKGDHCI